MPKQSRYPWLGTLVLPYRADLGLRFHNYQGRCGSCGTTEWTNEVHKGPAAEVLRKAGWHFVEERWLGWVCSFCYEERKQRRQEARQAARADRKKV